MKIMKGSINSNWSFEKRIDKWIGKGWEDEKNEKI